jgi:hypothetical protein
MIDANAPPGPSLASGRGFSCQEVEPVLPWPGPFLRWNSHTAVFCRVDFLKVSARFDDEDRPSRFAALATLRRNDVPITFGVSPCLADGVRDVPDDRIDRTGEG